MAQPTPYNRQFNFQDQQAQTPTEPLPADQLDLELNTVKVTLDETLVNLAKIQRDDGALKNGIVTDDSLAASLSIGFTLRGAWASATNYLRLDGVTYDNAFWQAQSSHLSVIGQTPDTQPSLWVKLVDFSDFAPAVIADGSVTAPKLASSSVTTAKIADANVTTVKIADAAVTNAKLVSMAASTIKGRITGSTGDPEDLTGAQVRSITGQKWVTLADSTLGSAAQAFQFSLAGYQCCRVKIVGIPNASASADFNVLVTTSTNSGVSFDTGAGNYYTQFLTFAASVSAPSGGSGTSVGVTATGTTVDKDSPTTPVKIGIDFDAGSGSKFPRMDGFASYFDGTSYRGITFIGQRQSAAKVTDIRIAADVADAFAIGSTILVEAC